MTTNDPSDPREAATHLAATDLFSLLEPQELAALAAMASSTRYAAGQVVTRTGDIDATLWIVAEGMVSVDTSGTDGALEQLSFGGYGAVVGESGVFAGQPRNSNVVTVEQSTLLHLEREQLWAFLIEHDLLDRIVLSDDVRASLTEADKPTAAAGEFQVGVYRRHWVVLLRGLIAPAVVFVVALALGIALASLTSFLNEAAPLAVLLLAVLGLGVPLAGFVWAFFDYYHDCLIVTNRRVIHIERKPMIDARRTEAQLGRIQDVSVVTPNVLARVFGYGDITVQTASSQGAIRFRTIPRPEHVRETVFLQADRAREDERRERQSWIDRQVRQAIGGSDVVEIGVGQGQGQAPADGGSVPRALARAVTRSVGYFWPKMRVQDGDATTWRKHWWLLIRSSMLPLGILFVTNLIVIGLLWQSQPPPWIAVGVVWLLLGLWLLWRYENWRNDLYQLTDEHVVDIERLPLGMFGERRQASLGQVQDVRYVVPNPLATVLNWGHVVIQTAAETGEFTFDYVFNPAAVHEEIVARIDAYRASQNKTEEEQRAREWSRWLASYHRLTGEADTGASAAQAPTSSPPVPPGPAPATPSSDPAPPSPTTPSPAAPPSGDPSAAPTDDKGGSGTASSSDSPPASPSPSPSLHGESDVQPHRGDTPSQPSSSDQPD